EQPDAVDDLRLDALEVARALDVRVEPDLGAVRGPRREVADLEDPPFDLALLDLERAVALDLLLAGIDEEQPGIAVEDRERPAQRALQEASDRDDSRDAEGARHDRPERALPSRGGDDALQVFAVDEAGVARQELVGGEDVVLPLGGVDRALALHQHGEQ